MPSTQEREAALFALALEKPLSERSAFLQAVCEKDNVLRQRLEALLAAHEQPDNLVPTQAEAVRLRDDASARLARPTIKLDLADVPDEAGGQTLGRYKLLEQIGEGGCGMVYVAEQKEPVRRKVALKVIKLGMDTKQVVARFEAERQALAMMDHPNIAKVLDAGTTETGRPYFVMELVRGIRITDYCDQANCTTKERLDLFIKVCQAIQHAHQKGIIHRDIKPSNILVTLHDGVPVSDSGARRRGRKSTRPRRRSKRRASSRERETLWTALAERSGDTAFVRPKSAVASDSPSHSKIWRTCQRPRDARSSLGLSTLRSIATEDGRQSAPAFPPDGAKVDLSNQRESETGIEALDQGTPPRCSDTTPAPIQLLLLHQIHQVALHQRLPIEAVRTVEHDFIFARRTARLLAGADQHVDQRRAGDAIRMADDDCRMRPRVGEVARPDVPLFHSASTFRVEALAVRRSARLSVLV